MEKAQMRPLAAFAVVGVIGLMLGGIFWGNLFTLITGEFPGPGPGFSQAIGVHVDITTTINTMEPERFVSGSLSFIPQLVTWYWSATGQMWQEPDGSYSILWSRHAGVLTTIGKNWIEDQMGDSPSADPAKWIALSCNVTAPSAAWTQIPNEIVVNGLERAAGTYASTGNGVWTESKQFTASGAHVSVQLVGIQWADAGDNNLLWADTFAPVTLANGDKLTITATTTVT